MDPKTAIHLLTEHGPIAMSDRLRIATWLQGFFQSESKLVTSHKNDPLGRAYTEPQVRQEHDEIMRAIGHPPEDDGDKYAS